MANSILGLKDFGEKYDFPGGFVFFGNKKLSRHNLKILFPRLRFKFLKQVHGNTIHELNSETNPETKPDATDEATFEADAMLTDQKDCALVIQTADCLPIMVRTEHCIAAVHAGWRGVALEIAPKTLEKLKASCENLSKARVWIGPHIQQDSFEVQDDTLNKLGADPRFFVNKGDRYLVNLQQIIVHQLKAKACRSVVLSSIDTVKESNIYFSYRACQKSGKSLASTDRNLSLIVLQENL